MTAVSSNSKLYHCMRRIVWCDHCHISVIPESPITAGYILLTNIDYDSCYCHSLIIIECDGCLHAHLSALAVRKEGKNIMTSP